MEKNKKHYFVTGNSDTELTYVVDEHGILLDLKWLMKEYYVATLCDNENQPTLSFSNGQKFLISVNEIK